jgi:cytochrome c peroxidase
MNLTKTSLLVILILALAFTSCQEDEKIAPTIIEATTLDGQLASLLNELSPESSLSYFKLPSSTDFDQIPQDPKNPLTAAKVALGQLLYHETALALSSETAETAGTFSCASCHFASAGFQAGRHQGIGEGGSGFGLNGEGRTMAEGFNVIHLDVQAIRSPSTLNSAYQIAQLWNGQFGALGPNEGTEYAWTPNSPIENNELGYHGLETQAIAGLEVHRLLDDETDISNIDYYKPLFDEAFGDWPEDNRYGQETAGLAIAAYERTLMADQAPFQQWLGGDYDAMTALQKQGALLFFGKANCVSCHTGPALNAMDFYALGMKDLIDCEEPTFKTPIDATENLGRGGFTNNAEDMFKFKVPQLYNLKDSPFYGHGASFRDLRALIAYKNEAVPENPIVPAEQLADEFIPLSLTAPEIDAITAFLEDALYDPNLARYEPDQLLSGQCFPNADAQSAQDLGCEN